MAKQFDRVRQFVSGTPGTGAITLGGSVPGFRTYGQAGAVDTNVVNYLAEDGTAWEFGTAVYATTGPTLTRTRIASSTGVDLNLSSSTVITCDVFSRDLYSFSASASFSPLVSGTPSLGTTSLQWNGVYSTPGVGYYLGTVQTMYQTGGYTVINDGTGGQMLVIGSTDPSTYIRNTTTYFQNRAASVTFAQIDVTGITTGLNLVVGGTGAFTGIVSGPTASANVSTTQLATTAYVQAELTAYNSDTLTFTNKTFNLANNTLTGTLAQFNTAISDADIAPIASPALTGVPTAPTAVLTTNTTQLATTAFVQAEQSGQVLGCGYLIFSSTTQITFIPENGNKIKINLVWREFNTITLSNSGLSANTTYYIYAFWSGTAVALAADTVAPVASSTAGNIGVMIKSGPADNYTLVGMARTNASAQFFNMGVLSWFNKKMKTEYWNIGNVSTTSASATAIGTAETVCNWDGFIPHVSVQGQGNNTASFGRVVVYIDAVAEYGQGQYCYALANPAPACVGGFGYAIPGQGAHTYTLYANAFSGTTSVSNTLQIAVTWG
jgi:hypothetical protein